MNAPTITTVTAPPAKPKLLLPSNFTTIIESAKNCFEGLAKTGHYFVRNGALVTPEESENGGLQLLTLSDSQFSSEIERTFDVRKIVYSDKGPIEVQSLCEPKLSKLLLSARQELRKYSLPLRLVAASPVLVERNGACAVLQKGYHPDQGGLYVVRDLVIPNMSLSDAVKILTLGLFADYLWSCPSDYSRAVAQVLSPAMKLGNLLPGVDFPLDLGLADQSQGGKTHRMKFTASIYGERAYTVINKKGGVGSLDESVASALCSGKLFILFDNVRGDFDSQLLESILRGTGTVSARIPYRAEVMTHTDRAIFQFTSNSANLTKDLVNRSIITNNQKQPPGYQSEAKLPWGEAFIRRIERKQAIYLGAVHTVLREWIQKGKPRTNEGRHNFSAWVQSVDWIVQNIFLLHPLMDDHLVSQEILSDKTLGWFRQVALASGQSNTLPVTIQAAGFNEICATYSISIPGLQNNASDEVRNQTIGRLLSRVFKASETVVVEKLRITRVTMPGGHSTQYKEAKRYTISDI